MSERLIQFGLNKAKHTAALLILLLLSTSVLSAAHVHFDTHLGQENTEQCAAYHVADHQHSAIDSAVKISVIVDDNNHSYHTRTAKSNGLKLPPSRAPPIFPND